MELPTYKYNRILYTVDYRTKQFRHMPPFPKTKGMRFYDFDSPEGDRILSHMIRDGKADLSKINL